MVGRMPDLPLVLQQFWQQADGGELNSGVKLYSLDEIDERNETFEVAEYAPQLVLIGDDSGGDGFFLDRQTDASRVYQIGLGAIGSSEGRLVSENLLTWLAEGAVSTEESTSEADALLVDIYLTKPPEQGMKALLTIKSKLKLDLGIAALKQLATQTPVMLLSSVYRSKYRKAVDEINQEEHCIDFRKAEAV